MRCPAADFWQRGLAAVVLGAAVAVPSQAAEVRWGASVSPGVDLTDNICLDDNNKKVGWIYSLSPAADVTVRSRKTNLRASAALNLNSLTNSQLNAKGCTGSFEDNRQNYFPNLRANGRTRVIDNLMDFNYAATIRQNEITSRAAGGDDPFDRRGNQNTAYRYQVGPSINHRFKDLVRVTGRYTFDQQFNSSEFSRDSYRHRLNMDLANASESKWSRQVIGRYTRVHYGENFNGITRQDTELSSARVQIGYRFNRRFEVSGYYGREWNQFQTTLNGRKDGPAWGYGVRWTPTPRTSVGLGGGDRFFGNTPRVDITHRHKRNSFRLSYQKRITFDRDIRNEDQGGFDNNIDNPSILSNGPILDERWAGGWSYNARGFTASLTGNHSEQTRSEDGEKSLFKNLDFVVTPQISPGQNISFGLFWGVDEPRGAINELPDFDTRGDSETWRYRVTWSKQLNLKVGASLAYVYTDRDGESDLNSYTENRIFATLIFTL
ncbi:MAG: TIGR03016 family PEP-CTERM system-associated outer membrane protein [Pseudomonadota bacterium]